MHLKQEGLKRFIYLCLLILCILSWTGSSLAQANRFILDNGMVVIIKERPTAHIVSLQAWVRAGSITEAEYSGSGISHFVEHMLFKGTKNRGVGQIAREVADCGGKIYGYTSYDRTVFGITISSKHLDKGLEILADALMNSTFDPEEFKKEGQVILREIDMNDDDPDNALNRLFWTTFLREHPYRHPVIGYRDQFTRLRRDDLFTYYQRMYRPNNIILVAAGDLKVETTLSRIKELFKDFKRGASPSIYIPKEPEQLGERRCSKPFDIKLAKLRLGFHIPPIGSEDVYPLDLLAVILGQGRSSRLYRQIKEVQGLVYSIDAWSYTPRYEGVFGIDAELESVHLQEAEKAIIDELGRLQREYVTDEELKKAKRSVIAQEIFRQETIEGEATDLALNELVTGNPEFSKVYISSILKVTKFDIRRVANTYFTKSNLVSAALIPKEGEVKGSVSASPPPPSPATTRVVLDNGLILLLREDHTLPTVCIRAVFKGGVRVENEKNNGISNFVRRMLLKGTKSRSEEEIANTIERVGGSIETYGGNNSFGVEIRLLKDDLEIGLEILNDILMNSDFPVDSLEKERKFILAQIKSIDDDPFTATERLLKETLFQIHPYRWPQIGHRESLEILTRDDLITFYNTYCRPNNMVLAIFGDIRVDLVIPRVKELFGEFKARPLPELAIPQEPAIDKIRRATLHREKEQAIIMIGFHGIDVRSPDRYTFEVMTSILSSQDGRLFVALREENPISYSVGSYSILGLDKGAYIFYISTAPRLGDEATRGLLAQIKRLQEGGVTDEELERAKRRLIGARDISLQSNSSASFYTSLDELYGLGYKNTERYREEINLVSREDIRRVANTYFNLNTYGLAILRPEEGVSAR